MELHNPSAPEAHGVVLGQVLSLDASRIASRLFRSTRERDSWRWSRFSFQSGELRANGAGLKKFLDLPVARIIPGKTRNTTETLALLKASRPSTATPNWPLPAVSESGLLKALSFRRAKNRPQA